MAQDRTNGDARPAARRRSRKGRLPGEDELHARGMASAIIRGRVFFPPGTVSRMHIPAEPATANGADAGESASDNADGAASAAASDGNGAAEPQQRWQLNRQYRDKETRDTADRISDHIRMGKHQCVAMEHALEISGSGEPGRELLKRIAAVGRREAVRDALSILAGRLHDPLVREVVLAASADRDLADFVKRLQKMPASKRDSAKRMLTKLEASDLEMSDVNSGTGRFRRALAAARAAWNA